MHFLITAGPTREPLDPVRFLSNRSSGKMGYALAEAALAAGHEVTLLTGPVALSIAPREGLTLRRIESAQDLWEAACRACADTQRPIDIAILAAAVADYRPKQKAEQKIKKHDENLTLELERTPDVLGSMRQPFGFTGFLVGFAAETQHLIENAQGKLQRKGCDLLVANDVSGPQTGFDSEENKVILCFPSGKTEELPQQPKSALAHEIVRRCVALATARTPT